MGDPREYFFELPAAGAPSPFEIRQRMVSDIAWFNENRATARSFHPVNGIEGVVIHATAGGSTAGALAHWRTAGVQGSAHWIVPDEDESGHGEEVLSVVSESLAAWHVRNAVTHPRLNNRKKINHWTLGIEIVNAQNNSDRFSDWQLEITALLVRYCWSKYPNLRWIFSHALVDPQRRSDPGSGFDWELFTALVRSSDNDPPQDVEMADLAALAASQPAKSEICM